MKRLKQYIVEFEENSTIKDKIYLSDYIVYSNNCYLIIVIIYNKYIFFANNRI